MAQGCRASSAGAAIAGLRRDDERRVAAIEPSWSIW